MRSTAVAVIALLLAASACSLSNVTESSDGFSTPEAHRFDVIQRVRVDPGADHADPVEAFNAVCRSMASGSDDGFGQAIVDGAIGSSLPAGVFLDLTGRLIEKLESNPRACEAGLTDVNTSTEQ